MADPTLVLAHGAGAGSAHPWMSHVASALESRGVRVVRFDFPYMFSGRRLPDKGPVLEAAFAEQWAQVAATTTGPMYAGGKSMGGRIASQVAAKGGFDPIPTGLIFFGYPLHPPGKPEQRRDRHLPLIGVPMLFLHGTRDPFGTREEMRDLIDELPTSTLSLVERGDHSLVATRNKPVSGLVIDAVRDWMDVNSVADDRRL
ncbi:MAG: alpha/beta fold hydrolase [Acidobacteria bacterium]|nr:alpha/beta fold hydrolase [Acidobacteriota bacterium]